MLYQVIREEMLTSLARQLDYCPKAEEVPVVAKVMYSDLSRIGLTDADADRVRASFQRIAVEVGRWPTAFMIREHMPKAPALPSDQRNVPRSNNAVRHKYAKSLNNVNRYVSEYIKQHPGTTNREACVSYMKQTGITPPDHLDETEDEREARLEREAIQNETVM